MCPPLRIPLAQPLQPVPKRGSREVQRMAGKDARIKIKRAYVDAEPGDGYRVLVDRLWPRGIRKENLLLDQWDKEIAPTPELRRWFGHDPARWEEFRRRYRQELAEPERRRLLAELGAKAASGPITLVYGARDEEHNGAVVLKELLEAA